MLNFTGGIKRELLSKKNKSRRAQIAALSAFLRTSGCISFTRDGLGFFLVTESERIAERYMASIERLYGVACTAQAAEDRLRGKDKLTLSYNGERAYDILIDLGIFERTGEDQNYELYAGISPRVCAGEEEELAYIRGAFLGSGSCTLPRAGAKTGYHLEFVFAHEQSACDFVALLGKHQLFAKVVKRKESFVAYATSVAAVSDFLSVVGATASLRRLNETAGEREIKNNDNRVNNCFVGNMDRSATAAARQCLALGVLSDGGYLSGLDEGLRLIAAARLKNAEASLGELAAELGLSKSCVNHRLRRLMELYDEIKENEGRRL